MKGEFTRQVAVAGHLLAGVLVLGCGGGAAVPTVTPQWVQQGPEEQVPDPWASPPAAIQKQPAIADVVERAQLAVVTVITSDAQGSGFHVGAGRVVTNFHVIDGAREVIVRTSEGVESKVTHLLGYDPGRDLAVLLVPEPPRGRLIPAEASPRPGESVIAIGSPRGLELTVTTGIVSALRELASEKVVQHTASISPGSSGGPLLDAGGNVIGINVMFLDESQSLNFAVAASELRSLLASLGQPRALATVAAGTSDRDRTGTLAHRCRAGTSEACLALGLMFQRGDGVDVDLGAAATWFDQGCRSDEPTSCYILALMFSLGKGVPTDLSAAAERYSRACMLALAEGCNALGIMYEHGKGVALDRELAARAYYKACDEGSADGCTNLGRFHMAGMGAPRNPKLGAALFRVACEAGSAEGCSRAGDAYRDGSGVARDPARAAELYQMACDADDVDGCAALGWAHFRGAGVTKDASAAAWWFSKACEGGDAHSCAALANAHAHGAGVPQNDARAAALYRRACDESVGPACYMLAVAHFEGRGVAPNPVAGRQVLDEAIAALDAECRRHIPLSCKLLATARTAGTAPTPVAQIGASASGAQPPDLARITASFRAHGAQVRQCLDQAKRGALPPQVEVEFAIGISGAPRRVRVLPAAVAATAVGFCLKRLAMGTRFGPQGRPVTVGIPIKTATSQPPTANYAANIAEAARLYKLPPAILRALIYVGSGFNPDNVSESGAMGLTALMPAAAREMAVSNPFDPRENVLGGARYLRTLANQFEGDLVLSVAAYHAGPAAVRKYHGVPPFRETRRFVKAVLERYHQEREEDGPALPASP